MADRVWSEKELIRRANRRLAVLQHADEVSGNVAATCLTSAPYTAAYAANKAFQIKLGEALWYELQSTGVDVLIMIGGLMNTQGDALEKYPRWLMAETAPVVREVLSAVGRKHMVIPGLPSRAFLFVQTRLMTRRRAVLSIGRFMSSGLGKSN